MTEIHHSIVYSDPMYYCAFPSAVIRPDGEALCAFRRAPDRQALWGAAGNSHTDANSQLVLVRSSDGGETWSEEPELIHAHPLGGSQDPCMVQLSDGSILCTSYGWALLPQSRLSGMDATPVNCEYAFLGGYLLRSDDWGRSWIRPIAPPSVPGSPMLDALGNPCPAFNRGAPAENGNGRLYWAVATSLSETLSPTSVHLLTSDDRGDTWEYACPIASDLRISFNETSLIRTDGGDLVAFLRTADYDDKAVIARSTDGGRSFHPWEAAGFIGHPCHAVRLIDGRILMVYGYRHEPYGIRARVLNPEATDAATASEIVIRDDGGSPDLGYPWAGVLPDGRALVVYYMDIGDGRRFIAASTLTIG